MKRFTIAGQKIDTRWLFVVASTILIVVALHFYDEVSALERQLPRLRASSAAVDDLARTAFYLRGDGAIDEKDGPAAKKRLVELFADIPDADLDVRETDATVTLTATGITPRDTMKTLEQFTLLEGYRPISVEVEIGFTKEKSALQLILTTKK